MRPSQVSEALRLIASKIDRSRNPDKTKVIADLRNIISRIASNGPSQDGEYVVL